MGAAKLVSESSLGTKMTLAIASSYLIDGILLARLRARRDRQLHRSSCLYRDRSPRLFHHPAAARLEHPASARYHRFYPGTGHRLEFHPAGLRRACAAIGLLLLHGAVRRLWLRQLGPLEEAIGGCMDQRGRRGGARHDVDRCENIDPAGHCFVARSGLVMLRGHLGPMHTARRIRPRVAASAA